VADLERILDAYESGLRELNETCSQASTLHRTTVTT
jgi:hypothetical protein